VTVEIVTKANKKIAISMLLSPVGGIDPLPPLEDSLLTVAVGVREDVVSSQNPFVMILWCRLTAPFRANNCPCIKAPSFAVMVVNAKMCPLKVEFAPKVTELVTCQNYKKIFYDEFSLN
jgi:hypothetical protein